MADQSCGCEYSLRNARAMLDAIGRGVIAVDACGAIVYINSVAEKVFHVGQDSLLHRPVNDASAALGEKLMASMVGGESYTGLTIREGEIALVANVSPILEDGRIAGAISLFREISELEQVVTELDVYRKMHRQLDAVFESSSNSN